MARELPKRCGELLQTAVYSVCLLLLHAIISLSDFVVGPVLQYFSQAADRLSPAAGVGGGSQIIDACSEQIRFADCRACN